MSLLALHAEEARWESVQRVDSGAGKRIVLIKGNWFLLGKQDRELLKRRIFPLLDEVVRCESLVTPSDLHRCIGTGAD